MNREINTYDDLLSMLDQYSQGIAWDAFYHTRSKPAPFIQQNELPDESLMEIIESLHPRKALELGCGEGRNAIYMAQQGLEVTALDLSPVAIDHAESIAARKGVSVQFQCADALSFEAGGPYDLIYDSGMLHHLAPHRRITYRQQLQRLLSPGGFFGLTCFASGDEDQHGADAVDDWTYYQEKRAGVSFTPQRLQQLFAPQMDLIWIRKMRDGVPGAIQGLSFMWAALFRKDDGSASHI